jgi:hypothetical protein
MYAGYGVAGWGMDGSETLRKTRGERINMDSYEL